MTAPAAFTRQSEPAVPAAPAASGTLALVVRLWKQFTNRRAATRLLELDDRMLKDIGLVRGDVFEALNEPLTADVSASLAMQAMDRRMAERARAREILRSAHVNGRIETAAAARARALAA